MSGATYRIEITHDPHSSLLPWDVRIFRLADGRQMTMLSFETEGEAEGLARKWVASENARQSTPKVLLVDDEGRDVHSVKA